MGNRTRVVALAVGTYAFTLPSGLVLSLDDCYYVPTLTKNIISFSYLNIKGFHLTFKDNGCSIMLNGVLYAIGTLCNGIYILDMSNPILTIHDHKRKKQDNLKSSYLWHRRLGHIIERRASGPLDLIHIDVCGLMSTHARGGFIYFITFNLLMTIHNMDTCIL